MHDPVAVTYHQPYGVPPRLFHVTFGLAGSRIVEVACDGACRRFQFAGIGYRPTSRIDRERLIERFLALEARDRGLDGVNAELLAVGNEPSLRRRARAADRQLPAGDRS